MVTCMLSEDSEILSDVQSTVNPLNDDFESLMGTLGLTERKPVPDPVVFEESDPLGIGLMTTPDAASTGLGMNPKAFPVVCCFVYYIMNFFVINRRILRLTD